MGSSPTILNAHSRGHLRAFAYFAATSALATITALLAWETRTGLALLLHHPARTLTMPVGTNSSLLNLPLLLAACAVCLWSVWNAATIVLVELVICTPHWTSPTTATASTLKTLAKARWLPKLSKQLLTSHLTSGALILSLTAGSGGIAQAACGSTQVTQIFAADIPSTSSNSSPDNRETLFPDICLTADHPTAKDHQDRPQLAATEFLKPPRDTNAPPPTYLVESGDNLWKIAKSYTHTQFHTAEAHIIAQVTESIYALNREVIGEDANLIFPGTMLTLPDLEENSWL